ncbi:hypothetical protein RB653_006095 [Dictyostelium firmibasis]|uniref:Uncharacterized protein n=1 Tax=Dictyostelium firmibasis TaxID=79012 RepID=A0AAN7U8E5_9MYCE
MLYLYQYLSPKFIFSFFFLHTHKSTQESEPYIHFFNFVLSKITLMKNFYKKRYSLFSEIDSKLILFSTINLLF